MLELTAGDAALLICPAIGGSVGGWTRRGVDIFRHTSPEILAGTNSRLLSCFPLIPFSNRIAWGRFTFEGEEFQLERDFGDHPHTIHGNAWQRGWEVSNQTATEAELTLRHDPATDPTVKPGGCRWPYRYTATLRYSLKPDELDVTITLTNTDTRNQPVGLGLHPFQPRTPQTALAFRAGSVWHTGADSLPDARLPLDGNWSFDPGRVIDGPALDNCYAAWTGRAEITRPEHGIRVTIAGDDIFRHLVVFTPEAKPFFAVEPASNMTDAINHMDDVADHGLRVVHPGDTLQRQIRFTVTDL
ncbi:aldose 1-epimerase [Acidisphaera sp. L21]|uniref:aldose 1-epimerase n=1 Tax=Acidisphaera sp. L21 TaxID=1641851 RepID=UPI00131EA29A|nr:aldose 1-epimerase [Acidisphaera sp. L21]